MTSNIERIEENAEFISVIFVTSGTRGDRLLFKYRFDSDNESAVALRTSRNIYCVTIAEDLKLHNKARILLLVDLRDFFSELGSGGRNKIKINILNIFRAFF